MKKYFLTIMMVALTMLSAFSQTAMTAPANTDSAATHYITCTVAGTAGTLAIQPVVTKVANTGATVAGYCLLQGSVNGTTWVNVPTWKSVKYAATSQYNIFDVDTFSLTNVTTAQTYVWRISGYNNIVHPFLYYRVAIVMTTTTVSATGSFLYRKQY